MTRHRALFFAGFVACLLVVPGSTSGQCTSDADCDDGTFCNGQEHCDLGLGTCFAVSACPPFLDGCVTRNGACDEANDTCVDVPDDALCDDGVFCNGIESCIVDTGDCGAVSACPPAIDGCVTRNGACDEANDTCIDVPDDALCDDGVFCNGIESCILETGDCGAVSSCPPFIDGCLVGGFCDEVNDECFGLPDDSLCPTGFQCSAVGECVFGLNTSEFLLAAWNDPVEQTSLLLILDPETGESREPIPTPFFVFGRLVDMATLDGLLWIATSEGQLFAVNINSGQPIAEPSLLQLSGQTVVPKSLAAREGRLYLGFAVPGASPATQLAVVSKLEGTLDPFSVEDFSQEGADFDGLAADLEGTLFSTDVLSLLPGPAASTDVYEIGLTPPRYEQALRLNVIPTACDDLTFTSDGLLYCLDTQQPFRLLRVDLESRETAEVREYESLLAGIAAAGPPGTLFTTLLDELPPLGTSISWEASGPGFDVIRGSLFGLRDSGGDFASSLLTCLADDFQSDSLFDQDEPQIGEAFFYIVRAAPIGSYGSGMPSQQGSRDARINALPESCKN